MAEGRALRYPTPMLHQRRSRPLHLTRRALLRWSPGSWVVTYHRKSSEVQIVSGWSYWTMSETLCSYHQMANPSRMSIGLNQLTFSWKWGSKLPPLKACWSQEVSRMPSLSWQVAQKWAEKTKCLWPLQVSANLNLKMGWSSQVQTRSQISRTKKMKSSTFTRSIWRAQSKVQIIQT